MPGLRSDRLLVGVLGERNAGKSRTWNTLFGRPVKTGDTSRQLELRRGEAVDVFLISGSFEERKLYAGDILDDQDCRIVLCSMQYVRAVQDTFDYVFQKDFWIYLQWLNPGYEDPGETWDKLGLLNQVLDHSGVVSIRSGKHATSRVREISEFIYGWATFRNLVYPL